MQGDLIYHNRCYRINQIGIHARPPQNFLPRLLSFRIGYFLPHDLTHYILDLSIKQNPEQLARNGTDQQAVACGGGIPNKGDLLLRKFCSGGNNFVFLSYEILHGFSGLEASSFAGGGYLDKYIVVILIKAKKRKSKSE